MRCEVGLIVEWSKCSTGDVTFETAEDVMEYVQAMIQCNAQYDHIGLYVENAAVKELDDFDSGYEEEKNVGKK